MIDEARKLIGRWAVCGNGRLGLIDNVSIRNGSPVWFGTRFAGGGWQSTMPVRIHPKDEALLTRLVAHPDFETLQTAAREEYATRN
jgi:hypothetical protein